MVVQYKGFFIIFSVFCAALLSGCVTTPSADGTTDVTVLASSLPQVKAFLEQYPNAKVTVALWDGAAVEKNLESIRQECGPQFAVADYYKVSVVDPSFSLTVWLDKSGQNVVCAIKGATSAVGVATNVPVKPAESTTLPPVEQSDSTSQTVESTESTSATTDDLPPMPPDSADVSGTVQASTATSRPGCNNLWWFDNTHNYCQQTEFCGAFMYYGLRTFATKDECVAATSSFNRTQTTPTVFKNVSVSSSPISVAFSPNGAFAYVANSHITRGSVSVVDTARNYVVKNIVINQSATDVVNEPHCVALSPDGAYAYVTNDGPDSKASVSVIDTFTNAIVDTIPVGYNSFGIALSPDGSTAYVASFTNRTVFVIDTATKAVVKSIPAGSGTFCGTTISPNGRYVYVTDDDTDSVSVISTSSNTVVSSIPVGNSPQGVAITPDGAYAYVTNALSDSVSVIDTAKSVVVTTIPVGGHPVGVAVAPGGEYAYVANYRDGTVSVIDTASNSVTHSISTGRLGLWGVAISPNGALSYATNQQQSEVYAIRTGSWIGSEPLPTPIIVTSTPLPTPVITGSCTDTDGGLNFNQSGGVYLKYFNGTSRSIPDFCSDSSVVFEIYCTGVSTFASSGYVCPDGCLNGACRITAATSTIVPTPYGTCPQYAPAPGWCSDGTIVAPVKSSTGCYGPPTCVRNSSIPTPFAYPTSTPYPTPVAYPTAVPGSDELMVNVSGYVLDNSASSNVPLLNAEVTINGNNGALTTTTRQNGFFYFPSLVPFRNGYSVYSGLFNVNGGTVTISSSTIYNGSAEYGCTRPFTGPSEIHCLSVQLKAVSGVQNPVASPVSSTVSVNVSGKINGALYMGYTNVPDVDLVVESAGSSMSTRTTTGGYFMMPSQIQLKDGLSSYELMQSKLLVFSITGWNLTVSSMRLFNGSSAYGCRQTYYGPSNVRCLSVELTGYPLPPGYTPTPTTSGNYSHPSSGTGFVIVNTKPWWCFWCN